MLIHGCWTWQSRYVYIGKIKEIYKCSILKIERYNSNELKLALEENCWKGKKMFKIFINGDGMYFEIECGI